jgi:hypothetical protein
MRKLKNISNIREGIYLQIVDGLPPMPLKNSQRHPKISKHSLRHTQHYLLRLSKDT